MMDIDSTMDKGSMSLVESYLLRSIPDLGQHSIISITVVCGDQFSCEHLVSVSDAFSPLSLLHMLTVTFNRFPIYMIMIPICLI
jgi:hypothetical protein